MTNRFGIAILACRRLRARRSASLSRTQASAQAAQTHRLHQFGQWAWDLAALPHPPTSQFRMEITVNKPAAEVWKRVGKFCDIAEWLRIPTCTITAGKDGEFGAVRSVANEVLVAKTELSYTYTQLRPSRRAAGAAPALQPVSRHARSSTGYGRPRPNSCIRCSSTIRCWPMMPRASATGSRRPPSSRRRFRT